MNKILRFESESGNKYIYDSNCNIVYLDSRLNDQIFQKSINQIRQEFENDRMTDSLETLKTDVNLIQEYIFRNGLKEFLLEVTTSCNLRCKYCIYSQNYPSNREHGYKLISCQQAFKAVNLYLDLCEKAKAYNPNIKPMIGFYGGEPLLNFPVIKAVINKIYENEELKDVQFTITTNGLLLDEEKINFLVKNNVVVLFSLDGPKSQHNRNRVDISGKGTFDLAMENINRYIGKRGYAFTNSVYDWKTDVTEVAEFFDSQPNLLSMAFSPVNDNNTNYYQRFTKEDRIRFFSKLDQIYFNFFCENDLSQPNTSDFLNGWILKSASGVMTRIPFMEKNSLIKHTGGCVPGDKMYATVEGDILICEKLNSSFKIGDIDTGLDYKKIIQIAEEYNLETEDCNKCVINKLCSICLASCGSEGVLKLSKNRCEEEISSVKNRLSVAYSILEKKGNWFELFNSNYQKELRGGQQ